MSFVGNVDALTKQHQRIDQTENEICGLDVEAVASNFWRGGRTNQELAVRLALGSSQAGILWLVLRQGLIGAAVGVAGGLAARQLTSGLLFGVSAGNPFTFAGAAGLLLVVVFVASAIPGARTMRVKLVEALRQE